VRKVLHQEGFRVRDVRIVRCVSVAPIISVFVLTHGYLALEYCSALWFPGYLRSRSTAIRRSHRQLAAGTLLSLLTSTVLLPISPSLPSLLCRWTPGAIFSHSRSITSMQALSTSRRIELSPVETWDTKLSLRKPSLKFSCR
jgi:hypothetical protein